MEGETGIRGVVVKRGQGGMDERGNTRQVRGERGKEERNKEG